MTVEPIREKEIIIEMYNYLMNKNRKYALLFKFGLNTGLRISDILPVRVSDIYSDYSKFKEYLTLYEKKTGKEKKIKVNNALRSIIDEYIKIEKLNTTSYLFYSNKSNHLSRIQAYRVLKEAANSIGIENFGTHSLRKTWGYWTYKTSQHNIGLIMDTFNHSSQSITLRYIGISQDQKDELYTLVQF
jgi:integrase